MISRRNNKYERNSLIFREGFFSKKPNFGLTGDDDAIGRGCVKKCCKFTALLRDFASALPAFNMEYHYRKTFTGQSFETEALNFSDYEDCHFIACDLSACHFTAVAFIACTFEDCRFLGTKFNHSSLRTVHFLRCHFQDVTLVMTNKLLFGVSFSGCTLDFCKFYTMKLKGTRFNDCRLLAADFMKADLREVIFERCDLYRAEFDQANAAKADFSSSFNFSIDPERCNLTGARFSRKNLAGLLHKHQITVL